MPRRLRNQTIVHGDLYIPRGNILSRPGQPYHGDFELVNVKIPIPAGTIDGSSINIYKAFIKGVKGTTKTAAGYPAMRYSDGTYVGLTDTATANDLSRGRVKITSSIESLHVSSGSEGYADGYLAEDTTKITADANEVVQESFEERLFESFEDWVEDSGNASFTHISHSANQAAALDILTSHTSDTRYGRLNAPSDSQDLTGDFIIDYRATRTIWQESQFSSGSFSSGMRLVITNTDGSIATLNFGWTFSASSSSTQIFYRGEVEDSDGVVLDSFDYGIDAPDKIGEEVFFRFRRTDDVIYAYYFVPGKIQESTAASFGQMVRVGRNPKTQPGSGSISIGYQIEQSGSAKGGVVFAINISKVHVLFNYLSSSTSSSSSSNPTASSFNITKDYSKKISSRTTITLPFSIPQKTEIISAKLKLVSETTDDISDSFTITPIDALNVPSLGSTYNYPLKEEPSLTTTFSPGKITAGSTIEIDITDLANFLSFESGHLSGYYKGFITQPVFDPGRSSFKFTNPTLELIFSDSSTGITFKVGVSIDPETGVATFRTKNILYDTLVKQNRTVVNFRVYLKKSGFKNDDVSVGIADLNRIGTGSFSGE